MNGSRTIMAAALLAAVVGGGGFSAAPALAQDMVSAEKLDHADKDAKDWLIFRGSYLDYNYSGLKQINAKNVKNLNVAWMHTPGPVEMGPAGDAARGRRRALLRRLL